MNLVFESGPKNLMEKIEKNISKNSIDYSEKNEKWYFKLYNFLSFLKLIDKIIYICKFMIKIIP